MLLAIDVGNTETTVGLFDGSVLAHRWRLTTQVDRTPDERALDLRALLAAASVAPAHVGAAVLGSVVPSVTPGVAEACGRVIGRPAMVVDARSPLPVTLAVDEPQTVGADRLLNTLAASRLYARDAIVVDLGTATTWDCITADGTFLGGVIAPGPRTAAESLIRRTAKLPQAAFEAPAKVIGTRTEECIQAGIVFGTAEAIDGVVRRIKAAWPTPQIPVVVATGGLADTFAAHCATFERVEPDLTLIGLRLAHELLAPGR